MLSWQPFHSTQSLPRHTKIGNIFLKNTWVLPDCNLTPCIHILLVGKLPSKKISWFLCLFFSVFQPALPFTQENGSYLWARWHPPPSSSSPLTPPPKAQGKDPLIWVKSQKCHLEGKVYFKPQSLKASVCLLRRSPTSQKCELKWTEVHMWS